MSENGRAVTRNARGRNENSRTVDTNAAKVNEDRWVVCANGRVVNRNARGVIANAPTVREDARAVNGNGAGVFIDAERRQAADKRQSALAGDARRFYQTMHPEPFDTLRTGRASSETHFDVPTSITCICA